MKRWSKVFKKYHENRTKKKDKDRPLLGAHVVGVVASMEHGVAARALRVMGVDQAGISRAVSEELESFHC